MNEQLLIGLIGALVLGVIGHGTALWYKIGKLEGRVENLYKFLSRKKDTRNE